MKFCFNTSFTLPNSPKELDSSYKTDLDFLECFGWKKSVLYLNKYGNYKSMTQLI